MKANELRIGNYVHYKNPDYENIPRIINYTQNPNLVGLERVSVNRIAYNQIEPIKLTEEWLLRFGLECIGEGYYQKEHEDFLCEYRYNKSKQLWFNHQTTNIGVGFNYVHELQNINFYLFGKELTLTK